MVRLMLQARDLTPERWPGPALPGWCQGTMPEGDTKGDPCFGRL